MENVIVDVDEVRKDLRMYVQKEIVEEVENPGSQMSLEEARARFGRVVDLGGTVNIPVDNVEFGRIAARFTRPGWVREMSTWGPRVLRRTSTTYTFTCWPSTSSSLLICILEE